MDSQRYFDMRDAYRSMYLNESEKPEGGKPGNPPHYYPVPPFGRRPAMVVKNTTNVSVDLDTKDAVGPGEVEKAYYTYSAGFDPTNREDVAKKDYDGSNKRTEETEQVVENRRAARSAGGYKDDSKKQTDPSKKGFTGISNNIKDIMKQNKEIEAKNKMKEDTDTYSELELIGDFLIENGYITDGESVDAFYAHMSDRWKSQILEKADDNGNTSCWDSHKKEGMKKKGGKMVNNCVPK